ncbi:MAG: formylglycine-generating enzyme family protein [Planktotalea sp.]|uniref:formylglycine-generating enzyme family protein n=1 Tax=Planktotalea sp. TaxID=2029877 RepID=UPI003C76AFCD
MGTNDSGCCPGKNNLVGQAPHHIYRDAALAVTQADRATRDRLYNRLVEIPGGIFEMGARKSTFPSDLDSPRAKVKVSPFLISQYTVTNEDFAEFVADTGYVSVAEREGWSFVFHLYLTDPKSWPVSPPGLPWWRKVDGAYWAAPQGPESTWKDIADHPVVHITWSDALAYCTWAGLRLPWEAEWERAARGGLARMKFPWGNAMIPGGVHKMNTWQGNFPNENTADDGYAGTAPVNSYEPNGFGLFNMTGNVWEWVNDYFGPVPIASNRPITNPTGPSEGDWRVQRGGSHLCHVSYCDRYHVHSRSSNDPDSSTGNCGFRVAASIRNTTW